MIKPSLKEEKRLYKKGFKLVVGIDEAGRGPLAGPVIACALIYRDPVSVNFSLIGDSKQLTAKQRETAYSVLKKDPNVVWGIGRVSEKVIDKINILQATKQAMIKAVNRCVNEIHDRGFCRQCCHLLIDGNFRININIPQKSIIRGDGKVASIAAASIIAKVTRDRLMMNYHKKYPQYGFNFHKGYPTVLHKRKIAKYGFCPIHRQTFRCS